jgi:hypothetical protein
MKLFAGSCIGTKCTRAVRARIACGFSYYSSNEYNCRLREPFLNTSHAGSRPSGRGAGRFLQCELRVSIRRFVLKPVTHPERGRNAGPTAPVLQHDPVAVLPDRNAAMRGFRVYGQDACEAFLHE